MGKGSRYRPVDYKKYSENYDRIFKKKDKDVKDDQKETDAGKEEGLGQVQ